MHPHPNRSLSVDLGNLQLPQPGPAALKISYPEFSAHILNQCLI